VLYAMFVVNVQSVRRCVDPQCENHWLLYVSDQMALWSGSTPVLLWQQKSIVLMPGTPGRIPTMCWWVVASSASGAMVQQLKQSCQVDTNVTYVMHVRLVMSHCVWRLCSEVLL
jgi:hypothetical protein